MTLGEGKEERGGEGRQKECVGAQGGGLEVKERGQGAGRGPGVWERASQGRGIREDGPEDSLLAAAR